LEVIPAFAATCGKGFVLGTPARTVKSPWADACGPGQIKARKYSKRPNANAIDLALAFRLFALTKD